MRKYAPTILAKTRRTQREYEHILALITSRITPVTPHRTHQRNAKHISPDPNDVDYFAVALTQQCAIWSNDKQLSQQDTVRIWSTTELLEHVNT